MFFFASFAFIRGPNALSRFNVLSSSELVLLGIAGGTALSSALIEANPTPEKLEKRQHDIGQLQTKITEKEAERDRLKQESAGDAPPSAEQGRKLAEFDTSIARSKYALDSLKGKSHGFVRDLISDANGMTFHRFQIVGWTLVLGLIYVANVVSDLCEIDACAQSESWQAQRQGTMPG